MDCSATATSFADYERDSESRLPSPPRDARGRGSAPGTQSASRLVRRREVVARQHHVAARRERGLGARDEVAGALRAGHAEVVGEDEAVEAEAAAQDLLQPAARIARRRRVDRRIDDVRRHDRLEPVLHQRAERHEIVRHDLGKRALVDRQVGVRIGRDVAVPGKVLADRRHARRRAARRCSAAARCATAFGLRWNARSPITALAP